MTLRAAMLLIFLAGPALAELPAPRLVADLRSEEVTVSQGLRLTDLASLGNRAVGIVDRPGDGALLWVSDGSRAGSEFLYDPCPQSPIGFEGPTGQVVAGRYWFDFCGLHVTDGTREGTRSFGVYSVGEGPVLGALGADGKVLVAGSVGFGAAGFFVVDPVAGTVERVATGPFRTLADDFPGPLAVDLGGRLGVLVSGALGDEEVWISDGSRAGTFRAATLPNARSLAAVGPELWVRTVTLDRTLVRLDGLRGRAPREVARGVVDLIGAGERAFFFVEDESGLALYGGERGGAIRRLVEFSDRPPVPPTLAVGSRLYFVGPTGLWTSDGTPGGTRDLGLIRFAPNEPFSRVVMSSLGNGRGVIVGGRLGSDVGEWAVDAAGRVTELRRCVGPPPLCPDDFHLLGGTPTGAALVAELQGDEWRARWTDGSASGSRDLGLLSREDRVTGVALLGRRAVAGGLTSQVLTLYGFEAARERQTLLESDGRRGLRGSDPRRLEVVRDRLYFLADGDHPTKTRLWSSDGRGVREELGSDPRTTVQESALEIGGHPVAPYTRDSVPHFWTPSGDLPGPFRSPGGDGPRGFLGGGLIFFDDQVLFRIPPSADRYERVTELPVGDGLRHVYTEFVEAGGALQFFDHVFESTADGSAYLRTDWWQTDGTERGTFRRFEGFSHEFPRDPVVLGGGLVAREGLGLSSWPLAGGPRRVLETTPAGERPLSRVDLVVSGGRVFYVAFDPVTQSSHELWSSDGTVVGTRRLSTALRFVPIRDGRFLQPFRGGVAFVARDEVGGEEPWFSDGTARGTRRIVDLSPGRLHSVPRDLRVEGDSLYFTASDGFHGRELWRTDGTAAGTLRLTDLAPGPLSSHPRAAQRFGDELFFSAEAESGNPELWAIAVDAGGEPARASEPEPPGPWRGDSAMPGFEFKALVAAGSNWREMALESACLAETVCLSGAVGGRPEVFLRVVGPKPNGFLWPTLVKLNTSAVQVWLRQTATGHVRYYWLEPSQPGLDELAGLFDRTAFRPTGTEAVRVEAATTVPPPKAQWFTSPALPGFRVAAQIGGSGSTVRLVASCIPETMCLSGAVPGRPEAFVRVVGPKPNGRLWPTLVRFTTSPVEIWIEQIATGETKHYVLPGAVPGRDELTGLFDREGFVP